MKEEEAAWNPTPAEADAIACWVDNRISSRIDSSGGYTDDYAVFGGKLIIATVDHKDAPCLEMYTVEEAIREAALWDISIEDGKVIDGDGNEVDSPYNGEYCSACYME